mgnify:CR=1 FL=1
MTTFNDAYMDLQKESISLSKNTENPFYKSQYVKLSDLLSEAKIVCSKHGFIFIQYVSHVNDKNSVKTELRHLSGESIVSEVLLPELSDPQKIGACITYMRRYSLTAILGVQELDDDGNTASGKTEPKQFDHEIKEEKACRCGTLNAIREGKYGPYYHCEKCGVNYK